MIYIQASSAASGTPKVFAVPDNALAHKVEIAVRKRLPGAKIAFLKDAGSALITLLAPAEVCGE